MKPIGSAAHHSTDPQGGFALLEMLAALAIAVVIFAVLAQFSSQSVRYWNRGESSIEAMEMLTRGIGRMGIDLRQALPMRAPGTDTPSVLFTGEANQMQFVSATGFGAGNHGLELISIAVNKENDGISVIRTRGPVTTVPTPLRDPVVLLRGHMQVKFGYRGDDGQTVDSWTDRPQLPNVVAVYVYGPTGLPVFPVPALLRLPMNISASCLDGDADDTSGCPQSRQQQQDQNAASNANEN